MDYSNGYYPQGYTMHGYQPQPSPWQPTTYQPSQTQLANQQMNPSLVGRTLDNEDDLRPNDITSDGYMSWYPVADGSCVIGRKMAGDGKPITMRYIPEPPKAPEPTQSDRIEEKLNKLLTILESKEQAVEEVATNAE